MPSCLPWRQQLRGTRCCNSAMNIQLKDSLATPQLLTYMTSHIPIMTLRGDFLSSLNARWWGSNSCPHRFPYLFSHTHQCSCKILRLSLPQPVCRGSKCCALHTRNLICMCRTLEVISWMLKLCRWESTGTRSVTHEMMMIVRLEGFGDKPGC